MMVMTTTLTTTVKLMLCQISLYRVHKSKSNLSLGSVPRKLAGRKFGFWFGELCIVPSNKCFSTYQNCRSSSTLSRDIADNPDAPCSSYIQEMQVSRRLFLEFHRLLTCCFTRVKWIMSSYFCLMHLSFCL